MAISFVGSKTFGHNAITAQSCSLTDLLNSAGASVSPAAGDIVLVNYVHAMATTATRTLAQCTPGGYSNTHASIIQADDSNAVSMALTYKEMPATPDTTVSIPAASATTAGVSCTIECWRGVNTATINTTTPTTASGANSALANPPSITTPATPGGCVVIGAFGGAAAAGAVFTNTGATPYDSTTNIFKSLANTTGTNDAVSGMGAKTGLAPNTAFDAAITGSTTTNTGSWGAASIVLRPTPTTIEATGSSTGAGAATGNSGTVIAGVGASSGTGATSGVGGSVFPGLGASTGTATVSGTSGALKSTAGASAGTSTSAAQSTAIFAGLGASVGASTASAVASATVQALGSSQGASTAQADAEFDSGAGDVIEAEASSVGYSLATGISGVIFGAVGTSEGVSWARGRSQPPPERPRRIFVRLRSVRGLVSRPARSPRSRTFRSYR